jgi:hypothetical protein
MYLLLEHNNKDIFFDSSHDDDCCRKEDDGVLLLEAITAQAIDIPSCSPANKRPRLGCLEERRSVRFDDNNNLWHLIPNREQLVADGVEFCDMFYGREELRELKRLAKLEVRIVELICDKDDDDSYTTEDSFSLFHKIVPVDQEQLQSIRIFLAGDYPRLPSSRKTLSCCLRGLEKHSARSATTRALRTKGLTTVLRGQDRLQQHYEAKQRQYRAPWSAWRHRAKITAHSDMDADMDAVAQLYKDVLLPCVEAALQRAARDELEAQVIYHSSSSDDELQLVQ